MTIVYETARDLRQYQLRFHLDGAASAPRVHPGEQGLFVRRPRADRSGADAEARYEAATGRWGLIPLCAIDREYPATFEARTECMAEEPVFSDAWQRGHRCVVLADALIRREHDNGRIRVARSDGQPLMLAGLWNGWRSPEGEFVESFALLTLPSPEHPGERWVVFLRDGWVDDWLYCPVEEAAAFLRPYNIGQLMRTPVSEDGTGDAADS